MAGRSAVISVAITGEAEGAKRAFDETAKAADGMKKTAEDTTKSFDGLRDAGGDAERRFRGVGDSVNGTKDVMAGLASGDVTVLAAGLADLGGAVEALGGDLVEWGHKALKAGADAAKAHLSSMAAAAKDTAAMVAHKAASIASAAATQAMAGAQWLLNAAMSANPIMLVVLALGALVAGFVLAWQHSETFREVVTGAFDAVKGVVMGVWNWISENWPLLLGILTGPIGLAVLAITKNWDSIREGASAVVGWVRDRVDELVGFVTGIPGRIREGAAGAFDGITDAFRTALRGVQEAWNKVDLGIHLSFELPSWVPGVGGKGFHFDVDDIFPDLHAFAAGGIATGPIPGVFGEAGPEALIPLDDHRAARLLGGGGGPTVVIHGNVYGLDDLDRHIVDSLARARRRGIG